MGNIIIRKILNAGERLNREYGEGKFFYRKEAKDTEKPKEILSVIC